MPQGDGPHGTTGIARDGALSGHLGLGGHRHRLDGVDGRDGVGTRLHAGSGRLGDVRDVGRHLRNDGYLHRALHTGGVGLHQFRTLAHVAAHALVLHLRAREVQFHGVAASRLGHLRQPHPLLLGLPHDGGNNHLRGVVLLQPPQDVKIHLHGVLAQLLHVAEAVEVAVDAVAVLGVEAGRHLLNLLQADGLIEHARPAGIEGTRHHLVVRTYRRRGKEERVLARDAAELDPQVRVRAVGHVVGTDAAHHLLDADGAARMDAGLLRPFQVGVCTVVHPVQCGLVVVETDGADGPCRVARCAGHGARSVLAKQTTTGLLIDINFLGHSGSYCYSINSKCWKSLHDVQSPRPM